MQQGDDGEEGRLKNPQYARMMQVLKERLRPNLGSFCLTLFAFNVAISFLVTAALSPTLLAPDSLLAFVLSLVFLFAMLVVIFTVCYGIAAKTQAVLLGKRTSRLVFSGFAGSRGVVHSSIFFAILTLICLALAAFVAFWLRGKVTQSLIPLLKSYVPSQMYSAEGGFDEQTIQMVCELFALALFCTVCFAVLFVLAFVPLAFVWCCLIENKSLSLAEAIKQSTRIVRGRYWHCLVFPFYASCKNIALCAIIVALKMLPLIPAVSLLLGFCAFIQYYTILSKFCFCVPIYFYSFLSVNGFIQQAHTAAEEQLEVATQSTIAIEEDSPQPATAGAHEAQEETPAQEPLSIHEDDATTGSAPSSTEGITGEVGAPEQGQSNEPVPNSPADKDAGEER